MKTKVKSRVKNTKDTIFDDGPMMSKSIEDIYFMQEETNSRILSQFEKHKGQFVISDFKDRVQRLVAVGEDDSDMYWIFWDGRKLEWHSCVGGFISLKGKIYDDEYQRFVRLAELNHQDRFGCYGRRDELSEDKILEIEEGLKLFKKHIISNISPGHSFLTEICWDLN